MENGLKLPKPFEYVPKPRVSCREQEFGPHFIFGLCDMLQHIPRRGEMVEVGCLAGEATAYFVQWMSKVHVIDPWDLWQKYWPGGVLMTDIETEFKERLTERNNVKVYKGFSTQIAKEFEDNSLDFVYIDADHSYQAVKADIVVWYPKVKDGGFLGGHDYSSKYPGTMRAVDERFVQVKTFMDTSWLIQRGGPVAR